MAITGAIFDCDGTLLDSMAMWRNATKRLLALYGVTLTPQIFEAIEPLALDETCEYIHTHFHGGTSGQDVMNTFANIVQDGYIRCPGPIAGIVTLLEDLRAHGVKMAVASSTSQGNLNFALEHFGLMKYFEKTFSTGGPIRSKEYPDIWMHAQEFLGTDPNSTWVFEDTPFGVREGRRAGLHTVCLFDPRMQRDFSTCASYADFMISHYSELSYERLSAWNAPVPPMSDRAESNTATHIAECDNVYHALIVGGSPEKPTRSCVTQLAREADLIIACDGGADVLYDAQITPDIFCGDSDSVSEAAAAWAHEHAAQSIDLPVEKDMTDLACAIEQARAKAQAAHKTLHLTLCAVSGGRPDHALGVIGLLSAASHYCPRVVENTFEMRVLDSRGRQHWQFTKDDIGRTVSVLALSSATTLSESGFHWNINHEQLGFLNDRGVSNVVDTPYAEVTVHSGRAVVYKLL